MNTFLNILLGLAIVVTIAAGPSIIKGFLDLIDDFYNVHRTFAKIIWFAMVIASLIYIGVYYFVK